MSPQFLETMKMAQQVEFEVVYSQHKGNGCLPSSVFLEDDNAATENDDDHLVEFSEALRTVAKTFRRAEAGKASAQAEAAEWKRKYELERARNLQWMQKESLFQDLYCPSESATKKTFLQHKFTSQEENGFENKGHIQDILGREDTEPKLVLAQNAFINKAHFKLSRGCNGDRNGEHTPDVASFGKGKIITAEGNNKQIMLRWETRPQTVLILTKPNSASVSAVCSEMVRWLNVHEGIVIYVEPRVRSELLMDEPNLSFVRSWDDDKEIQILHTKVDVVITLGGDGTVLWAASLFKGPVPLVVSFSMGSLGFMTPFQSENYRDCLDSIFKGPVKITLRNRLLCQIIRDDAKDELKDEQPILVLNEVTIDRGISSFLTNLECYCDDSFVTCVQGDGLILSTTSGSTAYSLAAGGSMVHPQVPGILFTPICPHSLSFRPLILPDSATIRVQVPFNSRGHAWASFDGKNRKELAPGDALIVTIAPWPVPTACLVDSTNDFFRSIHDGLHWNLRKSQSFDGPQKS